MAGKMIDHMQVYVEEEIAKRVEERLAALEKSSEEARSDGLTKGRAEGRAEGLRVVLGRQLLRRFPDRDSAELQRRLAAIAEAERLEVLGERLIDGVGWDELWG